MVVKKVCVHVDMVQTKFDGYAVGWGVAQLVELWTGVQLMQVQFPSAARDFSPTVSFQCRLSYGAHTPLRAIVLTFMRTLKTLQSMSEFDGLWKHKNAEHESWRQKNQLEIVVA